MVAPLLPSKRIAFLQGSTPFGLTWAESSWLESVPAQVNVTRFYGISNFISGPNSFDEVFVGLAASEVLIKTPKAFGPLTASLVQGG
jgi:hypothetical protein